MALSADEVRYIARLARVALGGDEVERLQEQLSAILDHFAVLNEIDTDNVPPTAQTFEMTNVDREDEPEPSATRDDVLANAPRRQDGYFRVRAVLD
ncbi:MAG: Asp-tRNA(Asn)/Glu-tRNA(Gln) amidotransferase subunit GatC [Dehalococcoidia bacterium]